MVNKELVMGIATFVVDWMKDVTKQLTRIADTNDKAVEVMIGFRDKQSTIDSLDKSVSTRDRVIQDLTVEHTKLKDYVRTINLNVPEPYHCPQLDLSMVRMRTALAQVEMVLATIPKLNLLDPMTAGLIEKELREALIPK